MIGTSLAVEFNGSQEPLRLRKHPLPALGSGEVLAKVVLGTLCGSDLHTFEGRRATPIPTILGHEMLGQVAALPPEEEVRDHTGRPLKLGDRVTWSVTASCDTCFFCTHDLPQKCERLFKYGHEPVNDLHPLSGGLSEYCHLKAGTSIFVVPDEVPDAVACPANCATATVAAALRYGGDCSNETVLVQGAGMLGLTATAMAKWRGALNVVVSDVNPQRQREASRFGATHTVAVGEDSGELGRVVSELTEGRGVDLALEMSGDPSAMESGLELLRIGGRYILAGGVFPSRAPAVPMEMVIRKLLRIQGVHNYTPSDLGVALGFLRESHSVYPFEQLVSARFPLTDAHNGFRHAIDSGAYRVAVGTGLAPTQRGSVSD